MSTEQLSPHLEPRTRPVDLACPGLMLAANVSLVLGYLWVGSAWSDHEGTGFSAARDILLPAFVAIAILALRRACSRRGLPGASVMLPVTAGVVLVSSLSAGLSGSHPIGIVAGASALLFGLTAFGSVLLREAAPGLSIANRLHLSARGAGAAR
jgi:hypothetical protein